jgi:hypothetical protein
MTISTFLRLLLTFLLLCPFALGQNQKQQLRKLMSGVDVAVPENDARPSQPQTYRELKLLWADSTKSSTTKLKTEAQIQAPRVSVVEDKKRSGTLPRQRSLELAPTLMFVAAVDASNKLRWWSIMPDPRVVRSETQTATGELRRQDYYLSNVTLVVAFPDDPEIATLRFYHPVWNGTDFDLRPLSVVSTR